MHSSRQTQDSLLREPLSLGGSLEHAHLAIVTLGQTGCMLIGANYVGMGRVQRHQHLGRQLKQGLLRHLAGGNGLQDLRKHPAG